MLGRNVLTILPGMMNGQARMLHLGGVSPAVWLVANPAQLLAQTVIRLLSRRFTPRRSRQAQARSRLPASALVRSRQGWSGRFDTRSTGCRLEAASSQLAMVHRARQGPNVGLLYD
jgi:hypothetical protein